MVNGAIINNGEAYFLHFILLLVPSHVAGRCLCSSSLTALGSLCKGFTLRLERCCHSISTISTWVCPLLWSLSIWCHKPSGRDVSLGILVTCPNHFSCRLWMYRRACVVPTMAQISSFFILSSHVIFVFYSSISFHMWRSFFLTPKWKAKSDTDTLGLSGNGVYQLGFWGHRYVYFGALTKDLIGTMVNILQI